MEHREAREVGEAQCVQRRVKVPEPIIDRDAALLAERLGTLPGMRFVKVSAGRRCLTVNYDVTQLDYRTVLDVLSGIGFPAEETRWSKLTSLWYQYLDENGRSNAGAPDAPCCSNPKGIHRPRK